MPSISRSSRFALAALGLLLFPVAQVSASSIKLSWLDDVVQNVITEAKAGGKTAITGTTAESGRLAAARGGRLFLRHEADEGVEHLLKGSDDLARAARRIDQPSEVLLQSRFSRLIKSEPEVIRSFATLAPAEKRLVVELGEAAQSLARRYPDQAEHLVRELGPEGLSAVRVFGDDVAEVLAKEGSGGLSVLRKTGRGGWSFFTREVLPHKKKLAAAGILAAFLANPDKFVDYTGRATEFAVSEFAKAGVGLASSLGGGAVRGLESAISATLASYGLDIPIFRYLGMGLAGLVVILSSMVLLGMPMKWMTLPFRSVFRMIRGGRKLAGL